MMGITMYPKAEVSTTGKIILSAADSLYSHTNENPARRFARLGMGSKMRVSTALYMYLVVLTKTHNSHEVASTLS